MKRKLIIHVGMGKTGSSSIQKTLRTSQPLLQKNGIKYLGLMLDKQPLSQPYAWHVVNGWSRYLHTPRETATEQLVAAFEEINRSLPERIHTLVWSNESLFNEADKVEIALQELKSTYDIEIVGYIRSPDSWIQSAYLQWGVKHKSYKGCQKTFVQWTKENHFIVTPHLERWRVIGRSISFYNFESISDVCQHFFEQHLPDVVADIKLQHAYDTPSDVSLALYAYNNSRFDEEVLPNDLQPLFIASGVMEQQQKMPPFNQLLPQPEDIKAYIEANRADIDKLNSYFSESGQPPFELSELRYTDHSVSQLDINRGLLQLIVHLSRKVDQLQSELQEKESQ